jgi:hypothetical protein
VSTLFETLAQELERPRELSPRVINYVSGTYSVDQEAVGAFLSNELPKLEEYEIDLVLSPVFTPKLADQAIFAELLGRESVPREQWPDLVRQLVERPTRAQLVMPDGSTQSVALSDVTVERYVHRLRLEASIPESLWTLLGRIPASAITDQPMLKALARRPVLENAGVRSILERYLSAVIRDGAYNLEDALELLNLIENRKPADVADLVAWIPRWAEALRQQIEVGSGRKPFFHSGVEAMHGGSRDQRTEADLRLSSKQNELAFLLRLQQIMTP